MQTMIPHNPIKERFARLEDPIRFVLKKDIPGMTNTSTGTLQQRRNTIHTRMWAILSKASGQNSQRLRALISCRVIYTFYISGISYLVDLFRPRNCRIIPGIVLYLVDLIYYSVYCSYKDLLYQRLSNC